MLSLRKDLDPAFHISLGNALEPLRDQGVAIVGSGMSYHDIRHFFDGGEGASAAFDAWLDETVMAPPIERETRLTAWDKAPAARACHPREEHLLPLMVVVGAAGDSRGEHAFRDVIAGKTISGFRFG
jgi:aromatic ring-opening dioxygenase catalytic subunit (LigB family)